MRDLTRYDATPIPPSSVAPAVAPAMPEPAAASQPYPAAPGAAAYPAPAPLAPAPGAPGAADNAPEHWSRSLPDDWTVTVRGENGGLSEIALRDHPVLAKYGSKDEAVKALVHAQRLMARASGNKPLPDDASDEERAAWCEAMGLPATPGGYALPALEGMPEDFAINEAVATAFKETAHSLGLKPDQVEGLYGWFVPLQAEILRDYQRGRHEASMHELQALRAQHGGQTPEVLDRAREVALTLGGQELLDTLQRTGAGDMQVVVNALDAMAPLLLEGRLRSGAGAQPGFGPDQLRHMLGDPRYADPLRRDPDFVRMVDEGYARLYPGTYQPGSRG
ncbi:MAG: hypothetical protein AB7E47_09870 [Desulfovibrionaceae bacterium]